ncbi:hypothetical protein [Sphingomonas sp. KR3-1]|uniref:hypothetical protein n=1 Tax=Sphingomonas sp. KR3-1 TaxID=3156611 RepID=UPI0032B4A84A
MSVFTVETIGAMQALTKASLADGDAALVLAPERGGLFGWDSAATTTEDGGTVFEADEGGAGRWSRDENSCLSVKWFGATGTGSDDTAALNSVLGALGGGGLTGRYQTRWPYGGYGVTQIRFDVEGANHEFAHSILYGLSTTTLASCVDLRGGLGWYNGMKVVCANESRGNYEAGVHHYTNALPGDPRGEDQHYPGYLDVNDLMIHGFDLGLCIGALPSQGEIYGQTATRPDDEAINAPLSELVYTNPRIVYCPKGLNMRQPNGKVTVLGGRIHSESDDWSGYDTSQTYAVAVTDPGSELTLIGGTIEHVQGGGGGFLAAVHAGRLAILGAVIETTVPSYVDTNGHLHLDAISNNGINTASRAYLEVGPDARGGFSIANSPILFPYTHHAQSGADSMVTAVDGPAGDHQPNPSFVCDFDNCDLVEVPVAFSGASYVPLVRGVQAHFRNCRMRTVDSEGETVDTWLLDDGADLLAGRIDRCGRTVASYPQTSSGSGGGWSFTVSGSGSQFGREASDLPSVDGLAIGSALRLTGGSGFGEVLARSAAASIKRDSLNLLRGFIKAGNSAAVIVIRVEFFRFGESSSFDSIDVFAGPESEFGSSWQPLMLPFVAPAEAEAFKLVVDVSNGSDVILTELSVR